MTFRVVSFLVFILSFPATAQTIYFNNLSIEDGLRNGNVRAFVKDHQGFMWIGTEDGLHRYDGQTFKVYRRIEGDTTSLGSNFILGLLEDKQHNIWIGTLEGGIYIYRRSTDDFRQIKLPKKDNESSRVTIRSMTEARDGYVYVGTDGFFRGKVTNVDSISIARVPFVTDTVRNQLTRFAAIAHDLDSNLVLSVNNQGIFKYELNTGKSYRYLEKHITDVNTLFVDRIRKLLWIGTLRYGLFVYDPATKEILQISNGTDNHTIRSNFVASIAGDSDGNVWLGADNGLSLVPARVDPFSNLNISTFLPGTADRTRIHGNIMKSIYVDRDDKVWIGTIYEGVNIYNKNALNFGSLAIMTATGLGTGTGTGNVNALEKDASGNIWIGLDGGGLYQYRGTLGSTPDASLFKVHLPESIDKIKSLAIDDEQQIWIGTWGEGLYRYNTLTGSLNRILPNNGVDIGTEIMALEPDGLGNMWIGTFDDGLFQFNIATGNATLVSSPDIDPNDIDRIFTISVDKDNNNVWIGKDVGGLNLLKAGQTEYHPIVTNHLNATTSVTAICLGEDETVWAGAPNIGLVAYHVKTNSSDLFNEAQGLRNSAVHSILPDSSNRLWVSHNAGISALDLKHYTFSNYNNAHGITASQFNNASGVVLDNGQISFGNIHGINFFTPNEFKSSEAKHPLAFVRLFVDNEEQYPGTDVLRENITVAKEVLLNHRQNSFSVQFAPLRFDFSDDQSYEYMLGNFDKIWQPAGNRRLITYTNLEPGKYTLMVRSSADGDSSIDSRSLQIVIVPAWYQTISFKVFLGGTLLLLALAFHRLRIKFLVRQKKTLEDRVEERTHAIFLANQELQLHLAEINQMNDQLREHQIEIFEKNKEIQTQNEELMAQHEHIMLQQDNLLTAREQLQEINVNLERTVEARTEQLNNTINNLNKTVFELDRFVYSASHDLSAPLKSINGLVQLINMEQEPEKIYEYTGFIRQTISKLEAVIKSMVDYARNTHILVNHENVLLHGLVNEVVNELAYWQEASQFQFINTIDETLLVNTDTARLKVVLHNLVSNSIKYRDRHKDSNWIRFACTSTATYWELTLEDNGIGIRSEYLDKVFNMYFRATDNSKGSGLGLFIVKETLAKIGGTIHVFSELGNFTRFVIRVGVG